MKPSQMSKRYFGASGVFVPLPLIPVCVHRHTHMCPHACACTHMLPPHTGTLDPATTAVVRGPESWQPPIF